MSGLLTTYIQTALETARYQILEDGSYFGEIPALQDVWSHDTTLEHCRAELQAVLEEWIVLELYLQHSIPVINGVTIEPLPTEQGVEVAETEETVSLDALIAASVKPA